MGERVWPHYLNLHHKSPAHYICGNSSVEQATNPIDNEKQSRSVCCTNLCLLLCRRELVLEACLIPRMAAVRTNV